MPGVQTPSTPGTQAQSPAGSEVRLEIQAMRAVAVALVVIFHLWPSSLPGGYVGVDVFFVISGFLITAHLLREADGT
ncbi:MAG: acyltransferase, partial [Actinobacteria bacterium]|nr:acyltransferase [Actinomycetota bacterium]